MKKVILSVLSLIFIIGVAYATAEMSDSGNKTYSWRYKMTVTVETPEGIKTGSAVRQMGNSRKISILPESGNPADVQGEAVVVDLGKRGVLFALISHQSDLEFYNALPAPSGAGATLESIQYYANLPLGTKGALNPKNPPGYPKLVTFTNPDNPMSVTPAQLWKRDDLGYYYLEKDRMEELFGEGVKLKDITLEITDQPVTWNIVDKWLPTKLQELKKNWDELPYSEKARINPLITFRQGEPK